ncbi:MAG TPA: molybdenum cofactor biosynthesis protein MoaE [Usitatibacteraceae bacterium]|nr:molybdenum cofactor biosynthesis protein MoaE [Usitatibacteraceae bacterium]
MPTIRVQIGDFDLSAESRALRAANPKIGAIAAFIGLVRDINDDAGVEVLTLEHYPGMTEKALAGIVAQAATRWDVIDAAVIHRVGTLKPLDQIVLVLVASGHRADAFRACEFIMDYLKTEAPFWKKETTAEGVRWVDARASDEEARERWSAP